jgi:hypothetical protein
MGFRPGAGLASGIPTGWVRNWPKWIVELLRAGGRRVLIAVHASGEVPDGVDGVAGTEKVRQRDKIQPPGRWPGLEGPVVQVEPIYVDPNLHSPRPLAAEKEKPDGRNRRGCTWTIPHVGYFWSTGIWRRQRD